MHAYILYNKTQIPITTTIMIEEGNSYESTSLKNVWSA